MKFFQCIEALGAMALMVSCERPDASSATISGAQSDDIAGWTIATEGDLNSFFDCLDAAGLALVSAHRGGPAGGNPENALETLRATMRAVPAIMEVDVAQSADGVLFLMHDETLGRTTSGGGRADETQWAVLRRMRLVDAVGRETDFAPPKFSDVLAWSKSRTILQIDFKRSARYGDVIDEVYRQGAEDRVILIAYSMASARKLHSLAPDMMISLSVNSQSELNRAVAAGVPEDRIVAFTGTDGPNPRLLTLLDRRNVETIVGTLGSRSSIDAEIARGGDAQRYAEIAADGADVIATDRPRAAYSALLDAGRAPTDGVCGISKG